MSETTTDEVTEYAIKYPDGTIKPIECYKGGSDQYARTGDGGSVRVRYVDGVLTADSVASFNEALHNIHAANLKNIRAAEADPFEYPVVVGRRVITITDPWAAPTAR